MTATETLPLREYEFDGCEFANWTGRRAAFRRAGGRPPTDGQDGERAADGRDGGPAAMGARAG